MKPIAWTFAVALLAAPALAQAPDAAHLALARQVTALAFLGANFTAGSVHVAETMTKVVGAQVVYDEAMAQPESDTAPPPPEPKFNTAALHASFSLGIGLIEPAYQDAVADAYASTFTDEQLRAMLAFFSSPGGRASIAARKAFAEHQAAEPADDAFDEPKPGGAGAFVEPPAERAFDASPVGQAIKLHQDAIGKQVTRSMTVLWPQAMQAAEADYCRRQACAAPEHKVFAGVGKVWDQIAAGSGAGSGH